MFIGVAAYLARMARIQVHGEVWIFLPAAFGLFFIGVIRMIQEGYRRRHPLSRLAQDEMADDVGAPPAAVPDPDRSEESASESAENSDQPTRSASNSQ
jgi:hypothetical protein